MSKSTNVLLAILVFIFAAVFCVLPFAGSGSSSYTWVIGLILALAIAVGSYFLFAAIQKRNLANQEKTANAVLSPALPPGEQLLAYVQCYTGPGRTGMTLLFGALGDAAINASRRKWYYLGLTHQFLILVQVNGKKPTGVQQVLRRGEVRQLFLDSGAFKEPKLNLQLAVESMELRIDAGMIKRAKELDAAWHNVA